MAGMNVVVDDGSGALYLFPFVLLVVVVDGGGCGWVWFLLLYGGDFN